MYNVNALVIKYVLSRRNEVIVNGHNMCGVNALIMVLISKIAMKNNLNIQN